MGWTEVPDSPQRVLIVDDQPFVGDVLAKWLTEEGYRCVPALDAAEALEVLANSSVSLVIAEVMLPGRSGIDLLAEIKERFPLVAVIIATAVHDRTTAVAALQQGAYGYIIKPFDRNEVSISVVNALERRRLEIASHRYERMLEEQVSTTTDELRASREEIALRLMAAQEFRHDETGAHVRRLGLYSEAIALRMGYSKPAAELLRLAAPMHDVGKIGIPDSILMKPGKLTRLEFQIMKTHTTIGGMILSGTSLPLLNAAREIALGHHERWDGAGYPSGRASEDITQSARIVAVLDVYDALVNDRIYRPALPEDEALAIMAKGAGTHFDPHVYGMFLDALPQLRTIRRDVAEDEPARMGGPVPVRRPAG